MHFSRHVHQHPTLIVTMTSVHLSWSQRMYMHVQHVRTLAEFRPYHHVHDATQRTQQTQAADWVTASNMCVPSETTVFQCLKHAHSCGQQDPSLACAVLYTDLDPLPKSSYTSNYMKGEEIRLNKFALDACAIIRQQTTLDLF